MTEGLSPNYIPKVLYSDSVGTYFNWLQLLGVITLVGYSYLCVGASIPFLFGMANVGRVLPHAFRIWP